MKYLFAYCLLIIGINNSFSQNLDSYGLIKVFEDNTKLEAHSLSIDDNDSFYTTGTITNDSNNKDILVVKYLPNGDLDTTFAYYGMFSYDFGASSEVTLDSQIQDDGKLIILGNLQYSSTLRKIVVIRLNVDGTLDTSFNSTGYVIINPFGDKDFSSRIMLTADNKILIGGGISDSNNSSSSMAFIKLNMDGSYDNSFGNLGFKLNDTSVHHFLGTRPNYNYINDFKIMPDNSIMALGSTGNNFLILKFTIDGNLDTSYGNGQGLFVFNPPVTNFSYSQSRFHITNDNYIILYVSNLCINCGFIPGGTTK